MAVRKARPVPLTPEEIRFRFDLWIEQNLVVNDRSGPEWVCVCPACGRSKLAIHVGRKAWHCLSAYCGIASWSPTALVAETLGVSFGRAREVVAAFGLGVQIGPVRELVSSEGPPPLRTLPQAPLPLCRWALDPPQREYARLRGISEENERLFGLSTVLPDGTGSKADRTLSGRILFPVWSPEGRVIFWAARAITSEHPAKVLNTPRSCREQEHGHSPYCTCYHDEWGLPPVPQCATADDVVLGLHLVRPGERVIVVEGPVDAAVCGPGFVATLRAWCSPTQAAAIAASGASEAVIVYDGDPPDNRGRQAGLEGALKSYPILSAALPTRVTVCPVGEDPATLGRDACLRLADLAGDPGAVGQLEPKRYTKVATVSRQPPFQPPLGGEKEK